MEPASQPQGKHGGKVPAPRHGLPVPGLLQRLPPLPPPPCCTAPSQRLAGVSSHSVARRKTSCPTQCLRSGCHDLPVHFAAHSLFLLLLPTCFVIPPPYPPPPACIVARLSGGGFPALPSSIHFAGRLHCSPVPLQPLNCSCWPCGDMLTSPQDKPLPLTLVFSPQAGQAALQAIQGLVRLGSSTPREAAALGTAATAAGSPTELPPPPRDSQQLRQAPGAVTRSASAAQLPLPASLQAQRSPADGPVLLEGAAASATAAALPTPQVTRSRAAPASGEQGGVAPGRGGVSGRRGRPPLPRAAKQRPAAAPGAHGSGAPTDVAPDAEEAEVTAGTEALTAPDQAGSLGGTSVGACPGTNSTFLSFLP